MKPRQCPRCRKPLLRPSDLPLLERAFEAFRGYVARTNDRTSLMQVVSDVWDGWAYQHEVKHLVRVGIVSEFKLKAGERSLSPVTWELTDYGLALFTAWAARP